METLAQRLQLLIQESGITHRALAAVVGVSHPMIGRWLKGVTPRPEELTKLAGFFEVEVRWLLHGAGPSRDDVLKRMAERARRKQTVRESGAPYGGGGADVAWLHKLKRHWHRKGAPREYMEVALQLLFGDATPEIIKWLNQDP